MQDLNEQVTPDHSPLSGLPFLQPDSWWTPLSAAKSLRGKIERCTDLTDDGGRAPGGRQGSEGQGVFLSGTLSFVSRKVPAGLEQGRVAVTDPYTQGGFGLLLLKSKLCDLHRVCRG